MTCSHLVPAKDVHAFYSVFDKTLTISAFVTLRPGDYGVQICRSLIDRAESPEPEYTIAAPKPSGVQIDTVAATIASETFEMVNPPAKVIVYSAGPDGPVRQRISVSDVPAVRRPLTADELEASAEARTPKFGPSPGKRATGWSRSYDYHEALADAVNQLRAELGIVDSETGFNAKVVDLGVQVGGFRAKVGLYLTLRTM